MEGPAKPPKLPRQLISPMDADAVVQPSRAEGSAQKEGRRALMPIEASVNMVIMKTSPAPPRCAAHNEMPATKKGMAQCQRRSPVRSELQPTSSIAGQDARLGIAVIRVVCTELK